MVYYGDEVIRFDWAMKRLLRQKANFAVLESFLSELLGEKVVIKRMLESEGNKETPDDKFNRVDVLAENSKGELIIIEIQNNAEIYYFQRMLYGTSKAITEYIYEGDEYSQVRKVYSISIVYFDIGQGRDYIYHGKSVFKGVHTGDTLRLSVKQQEKFTKHDAGDLFPEYYILRVNEFNQHAVTPLDEWIRFLKSGKIDENTQVEGLRLARRQLQISCLSKEERRAYERHIENRRIQWDVLNTAREEGLDEGVAQGRAEGRERGLAEGRAEGRAEGLAEGRAEGREEGRTEAICDIARNMKAQGLPLELIARTTGLSPEEVDKL